MYRIFLGPGREAKIDLTYHVGRIKRGQKIKVTPKEAEAMDKLPKSWGVEVEKQPAPDITVTKVSKKRRKRKSRKKGE